MNLRPNSALDAVFGTEPPPVTRPTGPLRRNDLLDDVFGIKPAVWKGESEPTPKATATVQKVLEPAPVARVTPKPPKVEKPSPAPAPSDGKRVTFWTPPDTGPTEPLLPPVTKKPPPATDWHALLLEVGLTEDEPEEVLETVVANVVPCAGFLEQPGEDLLYLGGKWLHRCHHCGEHEDVLVPRPGRNPERQRRPLFTVSVQHTLVHAPGCPYS